MINVYCLLDAILTITVSRSGQCVRALFYLFYALGSDFSIIMSYTSASQRLKAQWNAHDSKCIHCSDDFDYSSNRRWRRLVLARCDFVTVCIAFRMPKCNRFGTEQFRTCVHTLFISFYSRRMLQFVGARVAWIFRCIKVILLTNKYIDWRQLNSNCFRIFDFLVADRLRYPIWHLSADVYARFVYRHHCVVMNVLQPWQSIFDQHREFYSFFFCEFVRRPN